jgi:cephalosporin-C deacetylase-like acetyl esterase
MVKIFIHGLESTSKGTKGTWFREHFPDIIIPDFPGSLAERLTKLNAILAGQENLVLIGSSYGGMMATIFALENEGRVTKVILLAPALNFFEFAQYLGPSTSVPAILFIGRGDDICPPDSVVPRAQKVFTDLTVHQSEDDHLLKQTFRFIDWQGLLT